MRLLDDALTTLFFETFQGVLVTLPGYTFSIDRPFMVNTTGVVCRVSLGESEFPYKGPQGELIVAPSDVSPLELRERLQALRDRVEALKDPRRCASAATGFARLAEALGCAVAVHGPATFAPTPADTARRVAALAKMREREPAVAHHMARLFGLRLPRQLTVFAAFLDALSQLESEGMRAISLKPGGIMLYFEDGGLERRVEEGFDGRVHHRFRRDPPEFVTVMMGNTDGLHYGLWYDDPAELPTCFVYNHARDGGDTFKASVPTPLALLRAEIAERVAELGQPDARVRRRGTPGKRDDNFFVLRLPGSLQALRAALAWFEAAEQQADLADGAPVWAAAVRPEMTCCLGPALEVHHGVLPDEYASSKHRRKLYRAGPDAAASLVHQARAELASGRPLLALVVGRELHCSDEDRYEATCMQLLDGAYRSLDRGALADILEVHHRLRDTRSVGVYTSLVETRL